MLLYAITQRSLFPGDKNARSKALLSQASKLAANGVHYLQIREKDMPLPALRSLAASIVTVVRAEDSRMKILLNGPAAIAVETGCDGIHLTSNASEEDAREARRLFEQAAIPSTISAACHSLSEVKERSRIADILLYAPVFEKITPHGTFPGAGLSALSKAIIRAQNVPVLALGGVTAANAQACVEAGAAGIAAIRLFLNEDYTPLLQT